MTEKYGPCKSIVVALTVIFLLAGCNPRDNLDRRDTDTGYQPYPGNVSHQDVSKFLSSVRKVDGAAEAKYQMARYFQKRNKHKVALIELKEIIQIDPTFVKAYNAIGFSYDRLGEFKKAIRFYKLALKIDPNLDYVYNNLGLAYFLSDEYDSAIASFQKAIALNDQNKRFHNNLGFAYAKKGQFDLALEQFRITGDEYSANYRLGQILYREGNYEMALRYNEKAHHAKTSAQIMSSVSSHKKRKNSDIAIQAEELHPGSKSSGVSSDPKRTLAKRHEKKIVTAMPSLSAGEKESEASLFKKQPTLNSQNEDSMKVANKEKRQSNNARVEVEIEVSNGNGVNGMASRLGDYLRKKGFKVTRTANANSFSHEKTKIFYYKKHLQDVYRLIQEIPAHIDIDYIIELKQMGDRLKILIGNDMIPYDSIISKADATKHPS